MEKATNNIINSIKYKIREELCSQLGDDDIKVIEITDKIDEIDNIRIDEIKYLTKIFRERIKDLNSLNDEIDLRCNQAQIQIKRERESFKSLLVMRSSLNKLFNKLWEENSDKLDKNIDYDALAKQTEILGDKKLYERNNGVKIALAIKYDHLQYPIKKLCDYYITLNHKCHPSTKPVQNIYANIQTLKDFIKDYPDATMLDTKLNIDIISEFENEVQHREKLF